ncbi:MAG: hypothetical protein GX868_03165 [Actinobacteria bacterium]|nr:hypothetical protein [Actinomycetota bacterium]
MPEIASKPYLTLAGTKFGDDGFTGHVTQFEFQPTQPTSSVTDISGKVTNFGGVSGYQLALGLLQDWATAGSLSSYLVENDGEDVEASITVPGGTWSATVVAAAPHIGGTGNMPAVSSLRLQVKGKPSFTAAPVP